MPLGTYSPHSDAKTWAVFFKLDFSFPFLNHRNGIHSLQINTDVCMKLFLIVVLIALSRDCRR